MSEMASQITGVAIVFPIVCSGTYKKNTPKLRLTGLRGGNPPITGRFPSQRASNGENISIWWRHHMIIICSIQFNTNVAANHPVAQKHTRKHLGPVSICREKNHGATESKRLTQTFSTDELQFEHLMNFFSRDLYLASQFMFCTICAVCVEIFSPRSLFYK